VYAKGLQVIRVSDNRVVLKRGIGELLLEGDSVESIVEPLLSLLDGTRTREQVVGSFPAPLRPEVETLLTALTRRRLITAEPGPPSDESAADDLQAAFYRNFGGFALESRAKLQAANVLIFGSNLIARTLVRSLLEMGLGGVGVVDDPVLNNHVTPPHWHNGSARGRKKATDAGEAGQRFRHLGGGATEQALANASLICAASDLGEVETLLEVNRAALKANKPFLPVWVGNMVGHVGPLNYPFETACLRCYRLRAASNNSRHDVSKAIRLHLTSDAEARQSTGLLPPMAGVVGEVAAMEISKCIGEFAPSDSVGRMIEINLVSFQSSVRRVLKIPRCPDCSDVMKRGGMALTRGPQITSYD
jgi:bacteriocin biosynthesis cyclodehydratase domain-containing protein